MQSELDGISRLVIHRCCNFGLFELILHSHGYEQKVKLGLFIHSRHLFSHLCILHISRSLCVDYFCLSTRFQYLCKNIEQSLQNQTQKPIAMMQFISKPLLVTMSIICLMVVSSMSSPIDVFPPETDLNPFENFPIQNFDRRSSQADSFEGATAATPPPPAPTFGTNHGWAMVCAGQRAHTDYCQRTPREYYCSSNGYVVQRTTAILRYQPCEDYCVCLNINPRPVCLVGWKGTTTCL